jgi:hypothetical protein
MGRKKADDHVLVLAERMQSSGRKEWTLEGGSMSLSDNSDSEEQEMEPKERMTEEDQAELNKFLRYSFPFNPEMGQGAWAMWQDERGQGGDPLWAPNLAATMVPSGLDNGVALPLLRVEELSERIFKQMQGQKDEPWFSTDIAELERRWHEPAKEELGAKACRYLDCWERTCGGKEMMEIGMWTYWKDNEESPKRLRAEKKM